MVVDGVVVQNLTFIFCIVVQHKLLLLGQLIDVDVFQRWIGRAQLLTQTSLANTCNVDEVTSEVKQYCIDDVLPGVPQTMIFGSCFCEAMLEMEFEVEVEARSRKATGLLTNW